MYKIKPTSKFQKDLKKISKRGYDLSLLKNVINILAREEELPAKYKDHPLKGNFVNCRECHITHDWLLIYEKTEDKLYLYLTRTETHSDLY